MKYNQPAGALPGAPYVDGNRNTGEKGSIVPAAAIEQPQRELVHLIEHAGLTPSANDLEQVRKAIEALIDAATGGGGSSTYLLMSQARARLPIYPEILTGDGRMNVISPGAGTILVPEAVQFMHRGIFPVSTSDFDLAGRTFATNANKTYHLRWNPVDGFALQDLADGAYNPDVKAESDAGFDSTYDDMLIARVTTDSGNVATITNLANVPRLIRSVTGEASLANSKSWSALQDTGTTLNWARTPLISAIKINGISCGSSPFTDGYLNGFGYFGVAALRAGQVTRYGAGPVEYVYDDSTQSNDGRAAWVQEFLSV